MGIECKLTDLHGRVAHWTSISAMELQRSLDTPADSLEISGMVDFAPQNYRTAELYADGVRLFRGRVDRQEAVLSGEGTKLLLECRSYGAQMIDNEAPPREYRFITADELFREHILPFDFLLAEILPTTQLVSYQVTAGMREWDVFAVFCRRAFGCVPYVDSNDRVWIWPRTTTVRLPDERLMEIRRIYQPYKTISHIYVRDSEGYYTARAVNPDLQDSTLVRRRFIVPNPQYAGSYYGNAFEKMTDSMRETFHQELVFSGVVQAQTGEQAALKHDWFDADIRCIRDIIWRLDEKGLTTTIVCSGVYDG